MYSGIEEEEWSAKELVWNNKWLISTSIDKWSFGMIVG
jgi:hypothetical protein